MRGEKTLAESPGKIRTPHMVSSSASKERDVTAPPHCRRRSGISFVLALAPLSLVSLFHGKSPGLVLTLQFGVHFSSLPSLC